MIGAVKKGDVFAMIQTRLLSAGIAPHSPHMAGLQDSIQEFARVASNEAVAGAALCVTEHDIARAVQDWAEEERRDGQIALSARLEKVAYELIQVGQRSAADRIRALLRLPPEPQSLPPRVEEKLRKVLTATLPPRTSAENVMRVLRCIVRELAGEAQPPRPMVPQPVQLQQAEDRRVLGGDDRGPIFETHSLERPATRGPDARPPGYDKRTWDAAVAACSRWLLDQPASSDPYDDATRMLHAVRCPE